MDIFRRFGSKKDRDAGGRRDNDEYYHDRDRQEHEDDHANDRHHHRRDDGEHRDRHRHRHHHRRDEDEEHRERHRRHHHHHHREDEAERRRRDAENAWKDGEQRRLEEQEADHEAKQRQRQREAEEAEHRRVIQEIKDLRREIHSRQVRDTEIQRRIREAEYETLRERRIEVEEAERMRKIRTDPEEAHRIKLIQRGMREEAEDARRRIKSDLQDAAFEAEHRRKAAEAKMADKQQRELELERRRKEMDLEEAKEREAKEQKAKQVEWRRIRQQMKINQKTLEEHRQWEAAHPTGDNRTGPGEHVVRKTGYLTPTGHHIQRLAIGPHWGQGPPRLFIDPDDVPTAEEQAEMDRETARLRETEKSEADQRRRDWVLKQATRDF